jgi:hypothetical protein
MTTPEPKTTSRELIAVFEASAEEAYDRMYESSIPAGCYSDFKDDFASAIGTAKRAGLTEEAGPLTKRLEHCRAVYRSQFGRY